MQILDKLGIHHRLLGMIIMLIIILGSVGLFIFLTTQPGFDRTANNNVASSPTSIVSEGASKIFFDQKNLTIKLNAANQIHISISPQTAEKIRALQLVIKYDPSIIHIDDLVQSTNFDIFVGKQIDNTKGVAMISAATSGDNLVATISEIVLCKFSRIGIGIGKLTIVSKDETLGNDQNYTMYIDNQLHQKFPVGEGSLTIN